MTKKSNVFQKVFSNKKGSILAVVSLVAAVLVVSLLVVAGALLYKVANSTDLGDQAYYASKVGITGLDRLQPHGFPAPGNVSATCVNGTGIDFTNSTVNSIVCLPLGNTGTVLSVGSKCSVTVRILQTNTSPSSYSVISNGKCNASGVRTADNSNSVSIIKTINGCETCAQFGTGLTTGNPCVTSCGQSCNSSCASGSCVAGLCL